MKILAKDGKAIKLNGGVILPPSAAGSDVNIQYDVIDTSFFERNESDGSVTINPPAPATANHWAFMVQGVGVMTDYDTGLAPTSVEESSNFMMFASFDSNEYYNNVLFSVCGYLTDVDIGDGLLRTRIRYINNKYRLLSIDDVAKSKYFIWTVTSVINSVLITW